MTTTRLMLTPHGFASVRLDDETAAGVLPTSARWHTASRSWVVAGTDCWTLADRLRAAGHTVDVVDAGGMVATAVAHAWATSAP
jgi:hypothetical protein